MMAAALRQAAIPGVALLALLAAWQVYVRTAGVPTYILPAPTDVVHALISSWPMLWSALCNTLIVTVAALAAALLLGVLVAILFVQSRFLELLLYPYAVVLQVTPIVAVAPLIIVYVPETGAVLLLCAFLVAFFPILSNTTQGLKSADHNLLDLFELYGASRWQTLRHLRLPSALPHFASGLRIGGGLALIGAIVAEFTAGTAGSGAGLAFRILEAGRRLDTPRLFAGLLLITTTGVAIFGATSLISHLMLHRWHDSARARES